MLEDRFGVGGDGACPIFVLRLAVHTCHAGQSNDDASLYWLSGTSDCLGGTGT